MVRARGGFETDVIDLSRLTSEYGKVDLSVQGLRFDGAAALPLAVLMLSESRHRARRTTG